MEANSIAANDFKPIATKYISIPKKKKKIKNILR